MRFVRFFSKECGESIGWINDDYIGLIDGNIFSEYKRREARISIFSAKILAPVNPGKIICVGRNYAEHAKEQNVEIPQTPLLFLKPPSSIIGPYEDIILPIQSHQVEHEAELVVVIGKKGRWIPVDDAKDYIFGCTIGNDVTARDLQHKDGQWTRGKGFDTFCPIGPWIETDLDPADTLITCRVNNELRQMASTREMIFTVPQLVAFISTIMTLYPGDLIFTGTPAGIGPITAGDEVEVEIEGIGTLKNNVVSEQ